MTPISVPGNSNSQQGGFTLLEILVVLLVIGIISAAVALGVSMDDRRTTAIEASRLADLLEEAEEEAMSRGEKLAWSGAGDSYLFWKMDEAGKWQQIADDDLFKGHVFQDGISIDAVNLNGLPSDKKIVFNPSGVNTPFRIVLSGTESKIGISGDAMNRVTVESNE